MIRSFLCFLLLACGQTAPMPTTAQSPSNTPGPSAAPASPSTSTLTPPLQQILEAHNRARAEHCAPPLAWSEEVASAAAAWAEQLVARGCPLEHSRSAYGENLFMGTPGVNAPPAVVDAWMSERSQYDFQNGGFSMQTGHFTQVVWMGTQRLGCAMRSCDDADMWVCNYDAPGNMQGAYAQNVNATSCR